MDRFFSKLDLRDIKIDPEKSRFSPDDEFEVEAPQPVAADDLPSHEVNDVPLLEEISSSSWDEAPDDISGPGNYSESAAVAVAPVAVANGTDVLKVSSKSRPSAVAGAIAGVVREIGRAEVQAIGAGATNQAIKAVAIARDYLIETGIDAVCLPAFIDITIDNEDRTAIRLVIEPR